MARQALGRDARRHALGQWYTPAAVADLALALALPGRRAPAPRVLDPTCGDGVFLARARAAGIAASRLCGVELDAAAAAAARARVPGAVIHHADLFDLGRDVGAPGADPDGFDAVVGNPPYVRQERLSRARKQAIRAALARDWPRVARADLDRLAGRGDLAAACVLRALRLVRAGGRVALVVSSALLSAGYAAALWRAVATAGRVVALVDAPAERWFADAAVNAVILVLERARAGARAEVAVQVARLRVPTREAAARVRALADLEDVAEVRHAPAGEPGRWAACLRAPAAWFELEARARGALVRLGDVAEVRRGVTSGANDVFYLSRARAQDMGLERKLLVPLLRSPRDQGRIDLDPAQASHVALVCPPDARILARHPAARAYLHQHVAAASRPSLRSRDPWWALPVRPARLFLTKAYASRFVQRLARAPMAADQRVYAVYPRPGVDVRVLAGILNATFTAFALESLGRASLGEGALEWTVADTAALPIVDPRALDAAGARQVIGALAALATRPIERIEDEREQADRRALDLAVAAAAPGIQALLPRLWPALIEAVRGRNERPGRALS